MGISRWMQAAAAASLESDLRAAINPNAFVSSLGPGGFQCLGGTHNASAAVLTCRSHSYIPIIIWRTEREREMLVLVASALFPPLAFVGHRQLSMPLCVCACERERKDAARRKRCDDDDLSASKPLGERPRAMMTLHSSSLPH